MDPAQTQTPWGKGRTPSRSLLKLLELAVPAWQGSLSKAEKTDIERVQKTACHITWGSLPILKQYRSA